MSVFVPFWLLFIFKLGPFFIEQLLLKVHVREGPGHYSIVADVFCMPQDCCVWIILVFFPQRPSGLSTAGLIIRQRGTFTAASATVDFLYIRVPCGPALLLLLLTVTWGVDRLPPPNLLPFSWCHDQGIICFKVTFFWRVSSDIFWECGAAGISYFHIFLHTCLTFTILGRPSAYVLIWGFVGFLDSSSMEFAFCFLFSLWVLGDFWEGNGKHPNLLKLEIWL